MYVCLHPYVCASFSLCVYVCVCMIYVVGMEGVMVNYDGTVRDSDGSVMQFLYGEDGVDVAKASYSEKLEDLLQNPALIVSRFWGESKSNHETVKTSMKNVGELIKIQKTAMESQASATTTAPTAINNDYHNILDPCSHIYPPTSCVGSVSEKYREAMDKAIKQAKMDTSLLENVLSARFNETLAVAGEGVGCLSAQSIGEPATQMTLNTFHLVSI